MHAARTDLRDGMQMHQGLLVAGKQAGLDHLYALKHHLQALAHQDRY